MLDNRKAMVALGALALLSSCGYARERYYSLEPPGGRSIRAAPWGVGGPTVAIFSSSNEMHMAARVEEHSYCDVFNTVLGGPLIAISCLWYKHLPNGSISIYMILHRPCQDLVYDSTGRVERCARRRIHVKFEDMILQLEDGTRISPKFHSTDPIEGSGFGMDVDKSLALTQLTNWKHGAWHVEGLVLKLKYSFPPTTDMRKLRFLPGGLYLDNERQIFPPFPIHKSSGWKYVCPG